MDSGGRPGVQTDVHNPRCDNGAFVSGMPELQMHAPPQVGSLQHRTAPVAPLDQDQHWLGTKPRMAPDQRLAIALHDNCVPAVLRLYLKRSFVRQVAQIDATFDFASNNVPIYLIAQVIVRLKHYVYIVRPESFRWMGQY